MRTMNEGPTRSGRSLTYVALRKTNVSSVTLQKRCRTKAGVGVRLMLTEPQPPNNAIQDASHTPFRDVVGQVVVRCILDTGWRWSGEIWLM